MANLRGTLKDIPRQTAGRRRVPDRTLTSLHDLKGRLGRRLSVGVARLDGLGDWVLTIPLIEALTSDADVANLALIGGVDTAPLFADCGLEYVAWPLRTARNFAQADARSTLRRVLTVSAIGQRNATRVGEAMRGRFDLVVLPRWGNDAGLNLRSWAAATGAYVAGHLPETVPGLTRSEAREGRVIDLGANAGPEDEHEMHHLAHLMSRLGLNPTISEEYGRTFLQVTGSSPEPGHVTIHPSGSVPRKDWPTGRWKEVVGHLFDSGVASRVTLVGSPAERTQHNEIVRGLDSRVRTVAGQLPLSDLPALLAKSQLFLGADSGPGHIAAAVGVPTITLFAHAATAPHGVMGSPSRYRPWSSKAVVLQPERPLPGCSTTCLAATAHCVTQISVDDVMNATFASLDGGDPKQGLLSLD